MITSSYVSSTVFPRGSVTGCDSSLGGGWMIFHFRLLSRFCFLLIEFHYAFSISYTVLTCYVYYCCIWLGFYPLFSCFFAVFLLFSSKGSVTGCDSSLGSFVILTVLPFSHASSFRLLLLRLCNNMCAEALLVKLKFSIESPLVRLMRLNSLYNNNKKY